jgi:hypothetical protein
MREEDSRSYPVRENMRLQYALWSWERALWVAMAATALIAFSGILGHGPLGKATITDAGLALSYERFQRVTAMTRLTATISPSNADEVRLTLNSSFSDNFQIADIEPRPQFSSASPNGLELGFLPPETGNLVVTIWAHPHSFGVFDLTVAAQPQGRAAFSVLVYP